VKKKTEAPAADAPAPASPEVEAAFADLSQQVGDQAAQQQQTAVVEAPPPATWQPVCASLVNAAATFADNWNFSPEAREMIVGGLTKGLDKMFPGGFEAWETWGPWAQAVAGIGILGFSNFDPETRRLKPLRKAPPKDITPKPATPPPAPAPEAPASEPAST
jgi:hypothetical protein